MLKCSNNSIYTGITNNLENRMNTHKIGKGSKYVRAHLPFEIIYTEKVETKGEALKREIQIKKLSREEKINLTKIK